MSKFSEKDKVMITNEESDYYKQIGAITSFDKDYIDLYAIVTFTPQSDPPYAYFTERELTLMSEVTNEHQPTTPLDTSNPPQGETVIKDSGDRKKYSTGAVRDRREGKGMPCLIPTVPMERVAIHYELGRNKYSTENGDNLTEENWKAGFPLMDMWDSASRHLNKWKQGKYDEDHLAACIWNVLGLMELERRIKSGILDKSLDNRDINEFEEPRDLYKGENNGN